MKRKQNYDETAMPMLNSNRFAFMSDQREMGFRNDIIAWPCKQLRKWQRKKHPNRFAFMTANSHICHLKCGTWLKRHFDIIKVWPGMKGKTHKLPPRFLKYHMEISVLALILDSQPARNLESPIHRRNKEKHRKRERKWKTKENKISENRKTPHRHKLSEKRKRMH